MNDIKINDETGKLEILYNRALEEVGDLFDSSKIISLSAKNSGKKSYGRCCKVLKTREEFLSKDNKYKTKYTDKFDIYLNEEMVRTQSLDFSYSILLHEIIHTLPNCFDHLDRFRYMVEVFSHNASVQVSSKQHRIKVPIQKFMGIWCLYCSECGNFSSYRKYCSFLIRDYPVYRCSKCRNKNFWVVIRDLNDLSAQFRDKINKGLVIFPVYILKDGELVLYKKIIK